MKNDNHKFEETFGSNNVFSRLSRNLIKNRKPEKPKNQTYS